MPGTHNGHSGVSEPEEIMPRVDTAAQWTELTLEERRERRRLRREKQREDNVKRAAKMHAARLKIDARTAAPRPALKESVHVGCSGWRYWKWRDSFYAGVPQNDWFGHYLKHFDIVEINASFYSWPTVAGVQAWRRQPGKKKFNGGRTSAAIWWRCGRRRFRPTTRRLHGGRVSETERDHVRILLRSGHSRGLSGRPLVPTGDMRLHL